MLRFLNLCPADFSRNQIWNSCLVKHLPKLLAQLAYPNMCLITLLSCYANLRNFGTLVLSYEFLFWTLCHYVRLLVSSSAYDCILVYMVTPFLNHLPFIVDPVILVHSHPTGSHFVVMSRWTTLDLRRLMWNHGLSFHVAFVAFQQKNSTGQKPSMSRVGDVVITRRLSLAEY
jgi:hypothetical protein